VFAKQCLTNVSSLFRLMHIIIWLRHVCVPLFCRQDEAKLREALSFANACGAITTTERGAIPALPDKETVSRLLSTPHRLSV
jgi:hypothetical protein